MDGENYPQWRMIVEIHVKELREEAKLDRASSRAANRWEGERWCTTFFSYVEEFGVESTRCGDVHIVCKDGVPREELYSGLKNLNMLYDVVQKLLRGKSRSNPLSQYYADFKTMFEDLRALFFISINLRKRRYGLNWSNWVSLCLGGIAIEVYHCTTTSDWEFSYELVVGDAPLTAYIHHSRGTSTPHDRRISEMISLSRSTQIIWTV